MSSSMVFLQALDISAGSAVVGLRAGEGVEAVLVVLTVLVGLLGG